MVPLQHLHSLLTLIIALYEESGYDDFEEYSREVLNKYSEEFLSLWFLANLQTDKKVKLHAQERKDFEYERSLLEKNFASSELLDLIDDSFKNAISIVSKQLWTI